MPSALLLVALVGLQEPSAWERFGPGSWAEHLTTGKRDGAPVRIVEKSRFKEQSATEVVISLETVDAAGGRSQVDMKYPLPQRQVPKEDEGKKAGEEKLTIDGRILACEIFERRGVRRWVCPSVAANGGVLKTEAVSGSDRLLTKVLKFEEKVRVGAVTVTCWVREEIADTDDQKTTRTVWISDEVPGGVVRTEVRQVRGKDVAEETVTNLTGFDVVKRK